MLMKTKVLETGLGGWRVYKWAELRNYHLELKSTLHLGWKSTMLGARVAKDQGFVLLCHVTGCLRLPNPPSFPDLTPVVILLESQQNYQCSGYEWKTKFDFKPM